MSASRVRDTCVSTSRKALGVPASAGFAGPATRSELHLDGTEPYFNPGSNLSEYGPPLGQCGHCPCQERPQLPSAPHAGGRRSEFWLASSAPLSDAEPLRILGTEPIADNPALRRQTALATAYWAKAIISPPSQEEEIRRRHQAPSKSSASGCRSRPSVPGCWWSRREAHRPAPFFSVLSWAHRSITFQLLGGGPLCFEDLWLRRAGPGEARALRYPSRVWPARPALPCRAPAPSLPPSGYGYPYLAPSLLRSVEAACRVAAAPTEARPRTGGGKVSTSWVALRDGLVNTSPFGIHAAEPRPTAKPDQDGPARLPISSTCASPHSHLPSLRVGVGGSSFPFASGPFVNARADSLARASPNTTSSAFSSADPRPESNHHAPHFSSWFSLLRVAERRPISHSDDP